MKLSERIKRSRINRPDEWTMDELARQASALEAKIDELMLEHCPDEMTPGQLENWENNQQAGQ